MSDVVFFTVKDIEKIGLVCPTCNSELVITIPAEEPKTFVAGKTATQPHKCPACHGANKPFVQHDPDWLGYIASLKRNEDGAGVRLYFKQG